MAKWYLARPYATPYGPLAADELVTRIRQGSIGPDALVWSRGMAEWLPVRRIPELAAEVVLRAAVEIPAPRVAPPTAGLVQPGSFNGGGTVATSESPPRIAAPSNDPAPPATLRLPPVGASVPPPHAPPPNTTLASPGAAAALSEKKTPNEPVPQGASKAKKSSKVPIVLLVAAALVVGLLVIFRHSLVPLEKSEIYSPCVNKKISSLDSSDASKEVPCAGGTLATSVAGSTVTLVLRRVQGNAMAANAPELVSRVLPNLPDPTMVRALPIRQMQKLDFRGQPDPIQRARIALRTYANAEAAVEAYEQLGGHRFARWLLSQGRLEAENRLGAEGPEIVLQFFPGEGAPSAQADIDRGLSGADVPWAGPWMPRVDPPYLVDLRKTMMAQGWWYDDADAFMAAAATDGVEKTSAAAIALAVITEWLRSSDTWEAKTRHSIWSACIVPRMNVLAATSPRQRFDELAGAREIDPLANPPDYHNPEEEIAVEGRTFNASIGSTAHAYCSIAMGDPLLDRSEETSANRVIRRAPQGARDVAVRLIKSPKFLAALGEELVKARSQLLKAGPPEQ